MERRTSAELIEEMLPLKGAAVVDVGCGDGWLVRVDSPARARTSPASR